jgi:hypothetical protein
MGRLGTGESTSWETVQDIARSLPEAVEGTSYGTPAFFVRKQLFVRFHQSRECVVIGIPIGEREGLMETDPETFFITDHYLKYPWMLVRLATVKPDELRKLVEESWRRSAPPALVDTFKRREQQGKK